MINDTPYNVPRSRVSLLGCKANGIVIVDLYGKNFYLDPGKSWSIQSVADEGGGCYRTHTISVSNSGLIQRERFQSDLTIQDEFVCLELSKRYFSMEEDISFSIKLIGEEGIDYSGFCMFTLEKHDGGSWIPFGDCSSLPDYVPEPYPRQPGEIFEGSLPISSIGLNYVYQYELTPGKYRVKFRYVYSEGTGIVISPYFIILDS